jgi:hypothetical protein
VLHLTIVVLVAAAAILRLLWRRERVDAAAIDGFREALGRLGEPEDGDGGDRSHGTRGTHSASATATWRTNVGVPSAMESKAAAGSESQRISRTE